MPFNLKCVLSVALSVLLRLTVEEHVWFYGCLKGLSEAEVKSELDTLLDNVGLLHKRHEQTKNLSGKVHLFFYKNAVSLST